MDVAQRPSSAFTKLWAAETISGLGTQVSALALPLTATVYLRAPAFQVGLLTAVSSVAFLLVGLPSGPYVDRHRKRPILLACNVGRLLALGSIPVAAAVHALTMGQLFAVSLVVSLLSVPFGVAYQSYLPYLVGRDALLAGSARMQAGAAVNDIAGPSVAGALMAVLSAPFAILADALSYAVSTVLLFGIPAGAEPTPGPAPRGHYLADIRAGLRYIAGSPLRWIAAANASTGFFEGIDGAVILIFLNRTLHASPSYIGLVYSLCAVGGLAGALAAEQIVRRYGIRRALIGGLGVGAPFLALAVLARPGWTTILVGVAGLPMWAGLTVYQVTQFSYRQLTCPEPMRGRMNATMRFVTNAFAPLGALTGAYVGTVAGTRAALLIAAAGLSCSFLWLLRIRQPPPESAT